MECSDVKLIDLPDEILLIIFKRLENMEILYSLMDVHTRLNHIVSDRIFTNEIILRNQSLPVILTSPLSDIVLARYCSEILPKIHDKIQWLKLETFSMKRILLSASSFSNLTQLDIFILDVKRDMHLFSRASPLVHMFESQIVKLNINGKEDVLRNLKKIHRPAHIFVNMLKICRKLRHFEFYTSVPYGCGYIFFGENYPVFFSSTLVELHITVMRFDECLFLLDGRLNQLRKLFVITFHIVSPESTIISKGTLPNLEEFSLRCIADSNLYDEITVVHLQRMINLKKLELFLMSWCDQRLIDGNNFKENLLNYMPHLNQFRFNIRSKVHLTDLASFPSNDDIYQSFTSFNDCEILSCVDYFQEAGFCHCHVYTYPYTLTSYENISNNFPGGLFNNVQEIELFDERPFEHAFFLRVSQSFPCVKELTVVNEEPQTFKEEHGLNHDDRNRSIIEYSSLIKLYLDLVHDHYLEEFLFDTKTSFSKNISLYTDYEQLERVTQNFTSEATRKNCSKITKLHLGTFKIPEQHKNYFPNLK